MTPPSGLLPVQDIGRFTAARIIVHRVLAQNHTRMVLWGVGREK
jgi:hypothetical protein